MGRLLVYSDSHEGIKAAVAKVLKVTLEALPRAHHAQSVHRFTKVRGLVG